MKEIHIHSFPQQIEIEDIVLPVEYKIHPRAKYIKIRVNAVHKKLLVTLPKRGRTGSQKINDFIEKNHQWIKGQLQKRMEGISFYEGACISILGREYVVVIEDVLYIEIKGDKLICPLSCNKTMLFFFLKKILYGYVFIKCKEYAEVHQVKFQRIAIKDMISRWGSCSTTGNLSFNWCLIFAPLEVLNYVIIHEVCHLKEMNHSKRFWQCVHEVMPTYKFAYEWLRKNGRGLMVI